MNDSIKFITGNINKFNEIKKIIPNLKQIQMDLPEIQSLDPKEIIEQKLHTALKTHTGPLIVEDTSLYLDCLNGLPGPLIKWFLSELKNEGIYTLVSKYPSNKALAKTIIGFAEKNNDIRYFEGNISGNITSPKVETAFGWDAIFIPEGYQKTFGELDIEEKNQISMRSQATRKLKEYLLNH